MKIDPSMLATLSAEGESGDFLADVYAAGLNFYDIFIRLPLH
ncbi:hypothetical protein [Collimonas pratensis]|nr:hypothetical protein [Collimonas pratensis]